MFLRSPYDYYFGGSENGFQFEHNPNITVNNESSCSDVLTYDDWDDRYDMYKLYITKHKIIFVFRCYFVKHNENCLDVDGFINYVSLIYCTFGKGGIKSIKHHNH